MTFGNRSRTKQREALYKSEATSPELSAAIKSFVDAHVKAIPFFMAYRDALVRTHVEAAKACVEVLERHGIKS